MPPWLLGSKPASGAGRAVAGIPVREEPPPGQVIAVTLAPLLGARLSFRTKAWKAVTGEVFNQCSGREGVLRSGPTRIPVTAGRPGPSELGPKPLTAPTPPDPRLAQLSLRDLAPGGVWRHLETFVAVTAVQALPVSRTEAWDAAERPEGHRTAPMWGYLGQLGLRGALRTKSARLLQMGLFRVMWSLGGQDQVSPPSQHLRSTPAENKSLPLLCPGC